MSRSVKKGPFVEKSLYKKVQTMNKDTIQLNGFNKFRMPKLKGHVKITLHNPTTGKNEVVEGENIVTNAVRDIMAANILGGVDYSKIFPLWQKFYGGILCYENAHPTVEGNISPDDYFAYTQSQNPLTAHAGGTIIDSDHDDDMKRGNPAALSRVFTENSVKQGWEWSPSHGNGKITSLSLTNLQAGILVIASCLGVFILSWLIVVFLSKIPYIKKFSGYA